PSSPLLPYTTLFRSLVSLKNYPVALSGSYASFAPKSFTDASGTEFSLEHTVQVVDLLAGYQVLPYLAVGAGWASYGYSDELGDEDRKSTRLNSSHVK